MATAPYPIAEDSVRGTGGIGIGTSTAGVGRTVLLLPAMSSISTRHELDPLLTLLAPHYRVVSADWPGFGDAPRPRADWSAADMAAFLAARIEATGADILIAAGHAAGYALAYAAAHSGRLARLILLAPTWRGPFPTMTGGQRPWFGRLRGAVDMPLVGPLLYRLNVSRPMLQMMAREHVYEDKSWLAGPRLAAKRAVVDAPGARHASVRFVTGALDPVVSREAFLDLAARTGASILQIYGEGTPRRSRAEMDALATLPGVRSVVLPQGRLALHEEFPEPVAEAILNFLAEAETETRAPSRLP